MANSEHWDTGTSTPTDGNKGAPRIWNKIGGTWERQWEPSVNVSGSWKQVNKIWTKTGDEWKPVFWAPEIGEEIEYGPTQTSPYHWWKSYFKVKYLGGDPLDAASWSVMSYGTTYQAPSTTGSGNSSGVAGGTAWVTGTAGDTSIWSYTGAFGRGTNTINIRVGGTDYDDGGSKAAPAGSFMPVVHMYATATDPNGAGGGAAGWARLGYDNATEITHAQIFQASTPWGYSLT